jgi:SPOR domain
MRSLAEALARAPTAAIVAVFALLIGGSALLGFAISELTSGDGDRAEVTAPAAAPEAPSVVGGSGQENEQPEEEPAAPVPPARQRGVPGWPRGLSAHTVILVNSGDRAAALRVAKEARGSGLEAGLMRSDPYDLGSGLWIVYSGHFTTAEGARRQAAQLAGRFPGAYPQLVQSSQ